MQLRYVWIGLGTTLAIFGLFSTAASAQTSSCSSGAPCLYVTNNGGLGTAIAGDARGGGAAGILGTSPDYRGVYGSIGSGSALDVTLPAGVVGENLRYGTEFGVLGVTQPSGSGVAVYGDAGNSASAWGAYFNGIVGAHGNIYTDSNVYAHGILLTSDGNSKRDIKDMSYGLNELLRLRPIVFTWKDNAVDKVRHIGLIAQEVQQIVPELVHVRNPPKVKNGNNETSLALDYVGLIPLLIKAVQDQQNVISAQNARISVLESRRGLSLTSNSAGQAMSMFALGLVPLGIFMWKRKKKGFAPRQSGAKTS